MSASKKISIDKVRRIQEDKKTRRIIISAENGGHEIELNITAGQLHKIESFMVVKRFEAFVAEYHRSKRSPSKTT